jgi:hypothetical protein
MHNIKIRVIFNLRTVPSVAVFMFADDMNICCRSESAVTIEPSLHIAVNSHTILSYVEGLRVETSDLVL